MAKRWLALVLLLACGLPLNAAGKKNVVLMIADDLGLQLGCYGDKSAITPNLDALAGSGTRFSHAFASVSSCSPSRATLLTGLPTHQCGQYGLAHASHNAHSFKTVKSLPSLLKPAGYHTGVIAKFHVQPTEVYPFDDVIGGGGRNPVEMEKSFNKFLENAKDKPFFVLLGYTDPHRAGKGFANAPIYPAHVPAIKFIGNQLPRPYYIPNQPEALDDWADYYQSVARLDYGIGLILKTLKEKKLEDDNLVIFLSDNGPPFPGAKTNLYDAGIHLPLIIRQPGQKAGVTTNALASWTDIAPTVLEYCGVAKHAPHLGRSLLPVLEKQTADGWDTVYASHQYHEVTMYYPMRVVRTRTHKYILNLAHGLDYPCASDIFNSPTWQGVLKRKDDLLGERPMKALLNRPKEELYDLTKDPNELKNLSQNKDQENVLVDLRKKLKAWQVASKDPWLVKYEHE